MENLGSSLQAAPRLHKFFDPRSNDPSVGESPSQVIRLGAEQARRDTIFRKWE